MQINPIRAASPAIPEPASLTPLTHKGGPSFADVIRDAIGDVSQLQDEARNAIEAYVRGEPIELHQVMAATEEAQLSLEILVEMRNRFIQAYQTLIQAQ